MNASAQEASTPVYQFICVDKSPLRPLYKKYYVAAFLPLVPRLLTANFVTLVANAFMWVLLALAFFGSPLAVGPTALLFALLVHNYALGDYLDGMHARDTGTSSPLGEFLDHHLDVYNSAISLVAAFALLGILIPENSLFLYLILWLSYLAFGGTMVEEKERGELYFGFIGPFEAVLGVMLFMLSCAFQDLREFWLAPLWGGYPAYGLMILITAAGFLVTVLGVIRRIGYLPLPFGLFSLFSGMLAYLLSLQAVSFLWGWLILACFGGDYISRVMKSHLLHLKHPLPDLGLSAAIVALLALYLAGALESEPLGFWLSLFGAAAVAKNLWSLQGILRQLSVHWLWVNPRQATKG